MIRDLDLVLTIPDVTDPLKVLFKLPNIITRNGVGKAITVISKARVPIVKFTSLIGVAVIAEVRCLCSRADHRTGIRLQESLRLIFP